MNTQPVMAGAEWLAPLLARYRTALASDERPTEELTARYETLRLAAGAARHPLLATAQTQPSKRHTEDPRHVVVIGPTQAGKSSLVNALVGTNVAGVSALAGHTIHAQAFIPASDQSSALHDSIATELLPLKASRRDELSRDALGNWSSQIVNPGKRAVAPQDIVWDTPDFDSIDAGHYREAVLAPAALADIIVLVLSKDKYGDLSVWQRIQAVAALGTPLVVVLNKLDDNSRGTVSAAFASRWQEQINTPQPDTILLPWTEDSNAHWHTSIETELRDALDNARTRSDDGSARAQALKDFISRHTDDWLAPLQEAAQVRHRWQQHVREIQAQAMTSYQARYLDDTARFDVVQRTVAELLTLLELPGLASALARTRKIVTWPARTLIGVGRRQFKRQDQPPVDREIEVLEGILKDAILASRDSARDAEESGDPSGTWRTIDRGIAAQVDILEGHWHQEATALRDSFQPRLEAAARELHEKLEAQPALLNTLRATRVTTDAAGIALAVKSGGLAPADLIIAPAMLSITSLLAESALGRYIDSVAQRLKQELAELVREGLVEGVLGNRLLAVELEVSEAGLLGQTMDPALERVLNVQHAPRD